MATYDIELTANQEQTVSPGTPTGITNGDTVDATLGAGTKLTVDQLDLNLNVVTNGSGSQVAVNQGGDLVINELTLGNPTDLITFKLDHQSSITYEVVEGQEGLLNNVTFDFSSTDDEGSINDDSVGIIKILVSNQPTDLSFSVDNFQIGDKILLEVDRDNVTKIPTTFEFDTDVGQAPVLYLVHGETILATIQLPLGYDIGDPNNYKVLPDGTFVYACYVRDTLIATSNGQKLVQDLQPGDQVLTASGGVATVKWLGYRKIHATRVPVHMAIRAYPVRITAGALAPSIPSRDLLVSPGHHMYFDGMLVPAMMLVNGKTITQDFSLRSFEYYHVELDHFDILLAEGAPAESYVDTGNRAMFQNAPTTSLTADFGPATGRPVIEGIEVVTSGPKIEALRKQLLKRAEMLTQSARTSDPELRVEINGQEIYPETSGKIEGTIRFVLPADVQLSDLRILSRSAVVRETTAHARRDLRRVGVGLSHLVIEDAQGKRNIDLLDSRMKGLLAAQDVRGTPMRWTNGQATIPASVHQIQGPAVLELNVLRTYQYWRDAEQLAA